MKWVKNGDQWHRTDGVLVPPPEPRKEASPRRHSPWMTGCGRQVAGVLFDEPIDETPRCPDPACSV
jgi:hypothetical protein